MMTPRRTQKPVFDRAAEDLIFSVARDQVLATVCGTPETPAPDFQAALGPLAETELLGTFTSFKKRGKLRSCMGWMSEGIALAEALKASATSAAKDDPRFPPIRPAELPDIEMEVWILWGMNEVAETGEARLGTFKIGRHGLQIKAGNRRGLLLPGVATEYGMNPREFLEATSQKAGLPKNAWLDPKTTLYTFEGLSIKRPFLDDAARIKLENISSAERKSADHYAWNFGPLAAPAGRKNGDAVPTGPRPAAVAGMFYPKSGSEQQKTLDALFAGTENEAPKDAAAVLVPHAGWIYSGRLAAETLSRVKIPETVVILAPKHRAEGANWAIAPCSAWDFGGGRLDADFALAERIVQAVPRFSFDELSHRREHAVEVQLPLLARLAPRVKVVGCVIGFASLDELLSSAKQFGQLLKGMKNLPLLLISSDMNHFENEERTRALDGKALSALETLDPAALYSTVTENGITMCGIAPACFALEALRECGALHSMEKVGYTTSAESSGDTNRVVGYAGYIFD